MDSIIGIKTEQSQRFLENGKRVPVTKVTVSNNVVTAIKTSAKHGYSSVQIGMGKLKHPTKAQAGHAKKANLDYAPRTLKEIRLPQDAAEDILGTTIALETVFAPGDSVSVTGVSKGKGFAGVVKRYGFRGGPRTHGQSNRERHPGSIGAGTTPGRVYKGKRMGGHMGVDQVTIKNMTVVEVNAEEKTILIDGLVPGSVNSVVYVTKIGTDKKYVPLQKSAEQLAKEAAESEKAAQEQSLEQERLAEETKKAEEAAAKVQEPVEETVEVAVDEAPMDEVKEETPVEKALDATPASEEIPLRQDSEGQAVEEPVKDASTSSVQEGGEKDGDK